MDPGCTRCYFDQIVMIGEWVNQISKPSQCIISCRQSIQPDIIIFSSLHFLLYSGTRLFHTEELDHGQPSWNFIENVIKRQNSYRNYQPQLNIGDFNARLHARKTGESAYIGQHIFGSMFSKSVIYIGYV